jgi:hypothetical protein
LRLPSKLVGLLPLGGPKALGAYRESEFKRGTPLSLPPRSGELNRGEFGAGGRGQPDLRNGGNSP